MSEFDAKQERIHALLAELKLDALLLSRVSSFAWATCGAASYINTASSDGVGSLLITPDQHYLITNNIETPRFEQEEGLARQGWKIRPAYWHEANREISALTEKLNLGADMPYPGAVDLSSQMARLRADLTLEEGERFRKLGKLCAEAMEAAIRAVRPGMSEYQIAGLLAGEAQRRGAQPIVNLIATDQRVYSFRHPLPTDKKMEKYAMLVLCGRQRGLVASITRLVYFGRLPDDLRRKAEAVAFVDAAFIDYTRPGMTLGQVFEHATIAYADVGFTEEWRLHHQGGPAGYEPREYVAVPGLPDKVKTGQAYAWNPSITGTKSEDTVLVGVEANEVLTVIPDWPTIPVLLNGREYSRPGILEVS
jgi:antitoxin VapB